MVKLEDVCGIITDGTHQTPVYCEMSKGYPFLSSKNVTTGKIDWENIKYIPKELHDELYKRLAPRLDDILLAKNGTTGIAALVDRECIFDIYVSLALLRPSQSVVPSYLLCAINSPFAKRQFDASLKGIGVPNLHLKEIRNTIIPLPPKLNQQKIANVLGCIITLIEKRRIQISKLDLFVKSQFIKMFGNPVTNPMGWKCADLKDLSIRIMSGNTPKGGSQVYVKNGIMFFRSQNVWRNRIELDDIAYIDESTHAKMSQSSLKNKDILITKTGRINTENSSLGRAALFLGEDDSANINGHVYLVRLKKDVIHEFVLYIMTMDVYREYIRNVCVGGIDKRQINKEHLEHFPIIMPPFDIQTQFTDVVHAVEKIKSEIQHGLDKLDLLYKSLMQKYFMGELE